MWDYEWATGFIRNVGSGLCLTVSSTAYHSATYQYDGGAGWLFDRWLQNF